MIRTITLAFLAALPLGLCANQEVEAFMNMLEPDRKFSSYQELVEHYQQWFTTRYAEVEADLCAATHKNLDQLVQERAVLRKEYSQPYRLEVFDVASPRFERLLKETLKDFGVKRKIKIYASSITGYAAAYLDFIIVNEWRMSRYSDDVIKAVFAHELQHILFEDCLDSDHLSYQDHQEQTPRCRHMQLAELRADVFSFLKSPTYAAAVKDYFDPKWPHSPYDIHASDAQRAIIAKTICKQLVSVLPLYKRLAWHAIHAARSLKTTLGRQMTVLWGRWKGKQPKVPYTLLML